MPPELAKVHHRRRPVDRVTDQIWYSQSTGEVRVGSELFIQHRESGAASEDADEQGERPFPGPMCGIGEDLPSPVLCPLHQRGWARGPFW